MIYLTDNFEPKLWTRQSTKASMIRSDLEPIKAILRDFKWISLIRSNKVAEELTSLTGVEVKSNQSTQKPFELHDLVIYIAASDKEDGSLELSFFVLHHLYL